MSRQASASSVAGARLRTSLVLATAVALFILTGCGQKAPPEPPIELQLSRKARSFIVAAAEGDREYMRRAMRVEDIQSNDDRAVAEAYIEEVVDYMRRTNPDLVPESATQVRSVTLSNENNYQAWVLVEYNHSVGSGAQSDPLVIEYCQYDDGWVVLPLPRDLLHPESGDERADPFRFW